VERLNRTVTQILLALLQDAGHRKWTLLVTDTQKAINWTPHSGTLQTPHELEFGQPPQVYIAAQHRHQQHKIRDGLDNAQHRHKRNNTLHDTRAFHKPRHLQIGDMVNIETGGKNVHDKPKLQVPYQGPYPVIQKPCDSLLRK